MFLSPKVGIPNHNFGDFNSGLTALYLHYAFQPNITMKKNTFITLIVLAAFAFCSCNKNEATDEQPATVLTATGNINNKVNEFRNLLGGQLNTTTGQITGRREINWDGVPDSLMGKALPLNFFNPTSATAPEAQKRGLAYLPQAGEFRVSSNNFADINAGAASQFAAFSGSKTFANVSANDWEVLFQVAGTTTTAAVKGFGAVFSDVDLNNSTSLEFFNGTKSLGKYFVPAHDAGSSFSFLGVYFKNNETITKVQVSHQGNLASGVADISSSGTADLIVLDDFLYSEPLAH
jgi:hypothetical protein